jgi:hypothetical protein
MIGVCPVIVCFQCSNETKAQLDELVASGQYPNLPAAITGAVANLSLLQHALKSNNGSLVFGAAVPAVDRVEPTAHDTPARISGDAFFVGATRKQPAYALVEVEVVQPQPVTIDRWVFGQFSKLLPGKASCRALAKRMGEVGAPLPLETTAASIAAQAAFLGEKFEETDKRERRNREDALAVGFPTLGDNASKSVLRFANQFVGSFSKSGRASGLLVEFKLATITNTSGTRIELTKHGWDFAFLPNPAMDETVVNRNRFSTAELDFLKEHVRARVPHEAFAFQIVLGSIIKGFNTPEELDRACAKHLPARAKEISSAFVTTQRTGVISRASELGLVARQRDGARVKYVATEAGQEFLKQLS